MGAITYNMEIPSSIPAARMYKSFILEGDSLIPKILPQAIKSVEILEGDGGVGTIKLTTFGEGAQHKSVKQRVDAIDKDNFIYSYSVIEGDALSGAHHKSAKQRVDFIDKENFVYSYTVIEGDALSGLFESISYHIKIVPTPEGGSICKNRSIYNTKGDAKVTEEEIKAGKEKASEIFKAVETYLLANPDA